MSCGNNLLGIALSSKMGLRRGLGACRSERYCSLGIALSSTLGLRRTRVPRRLERMEVDDLGIALSSTVGLRPAEIACDEKEHELYLRISLSSTVGLRPRRHHRLGNGATDVDLGTALSSTVGLRLALPVARGVAAGPTLELP